MKTLDRQAELGRSLYEINTSTLRNYFSLQLDNVHRYLETNRDFGNRFAQATHVNTLVEIQREYGETLFQNAFEAVKLQNEALEDALNHTKVAFQAAFGAEEIAVATATDTVFDASTDSVDGVADNFSDTALDSADVDDAADKVLDAWEDTADAVGDASVSVFDAWEDTADEVDNAADKFLDVASDATDPADNFSDEAKSEPRVYGVGGAYRSKH